MSETKINLYRAQELLWCLQGQTEMDEPNVELMRTALIDLAETAHAIHDLLEDFD